MTTLSTAQTHFFEGNVRSNVTWQHWHQLHNHRLCCRQHLSHVCCVCSMCSVDCDTDHALVCCKTIFHPLKAHQLQPVPKLKLNISALKHPYNIENYQLSRESTLQTSEGTSEISPSYQWNTLSSAITSSAENSLGIVYHKQPNWSAASADIPYPAIKEKQCENWC